MTSNWGKYCLSVGLMMGVSACGSHKDLGGPNFQSDAIQNAIKDARIRTEDIPGEIRATVKNMFGSGYEEEVTVVHIPMSLINTLEFEQDPNSGLFHMKKSSHPIEEAYLYSVNKKSKNTFVDSYTPPFEVFLITEAVPYTEDTEYYLSTFVNELPYYYIVGVDLESAIRLGVPNINNIVVSDNPDVHTIVLLKKGMYGALNNDPPVESVESKTEELDVE
jgi:hypothetical protein